MKIIGVIPARYKSSRFPGKPLALIHGKPMIWWVYQRTCQVKAFDEVIVATDDGKILSNCEQLNIKVLLTSSEHQTGTDRVAEVAQIIQADLYVNIQGDEPLITKQLIESAIQPFKGENHILVSNLMTKIKRQSDIVDSTVPKVVVNAKNEAIYLSRLPIPYPKETEGLNYFKQICVYGFSPESLEIFRNNSKGPAERAEDIELLRFIENDVKVKMVEVEHDTVAVDTPADLELVRKIMPDD